MPLAPDSEPSLTASERALRLFRGRAAERGLFVRCLNQREPRRHIVYFHGDGGHGKSLLLRHLAERDCRFDPDPEHWTRIAQLDDDGLLAAFDGERVDEHGVGVARAGIDFGAPPRGELDPLDAASALSELRHRLVLQGLRFPLFDLALTFQRQALERPGEARLRALSASTSMGIARREVERLVRLDPVRELPNELPRLFAYDLNAQFADPARADARVVLFFDTHEAFWGDSAHGGADDPTMLAKDEWLRRLLEALDARAGIVAVVAGRIAPRWADASEASITNDEVALRLVGHLNGADAIDCLHEAGIADPGVRDRLLRMAAVAPGQHHPLYLGLCADMMVAIDRNLSAGHDLLGVPDRGDVGAALLGRLLRHCGTEMQDAVHCMAAARAFDFDSFRHVADALRCSSTRVAFGRLTALSFVQPIGGGRFRIHGLIRRILRARMEPRLVEADLELQTWYLERAARGDALSSVEALYHAMCHDPTSATALWLAQFKEASALSRHSLCRALGSLLDEVEIPDQSALSEALCHFGRYLALMSDARAVPALLQAAAAAQASIDRSPADAVAHGLLGRAHWTRAYYCCAFRGDAATPQVYATAIEALQAALSLAPGLVEARATLGNAHSCLADWYALHSDERALAHYEMAVEAYSAALALDPSIDEPRNNLGLTYRGLGRWFASRGDPRASEHFALAIDAFRGALAVSSHDSRNDNNLGAALAALADWQANCGDARASETYEEAIGAFQRVLDRAPDNNRCHSNIGLTYSALADRLRQRGDPKASATYAKALASLDRAIELAPDFVYAHNNRCRALRGWAEAYAAAKDARAPATYAAAIEAGQQAFRLAPQGESVCHNLGAAYGGLAAWYAEGGDRRALATYAQAFEAYESALAQAPGDVSAMLDCACARARCAQLLMHDAAGRTQARAEVAQAQSLLVRARASAPADVRIAAAQAVVDEVCTGIVS